MSKYKTDYIALQNLWYRCSETYLDAFFKYDKEKTLRVIEGFKDTLVDIDETGKRAIRSSYIKWEEEEWIPFCKKKLELWIQNNPFESRIPENMDNEYENIQVDYNHMRYRKIMQLIQDSGIGLGQMRSSSGSYDAGVDNIKEFTG